MPARGPVRKPGMAGDLQMPASVGEYGIQWTCTVRARVRRACFERHNTQHTAVCHTMYEYVTPPRGAAHARTREQIVLTVRGSRVVEVDSFD